MCGLHSIWPVALPGKSSLPTLGSLYLSFLNLQASIAEAWRVCRTGLLVPGRGRQQRQAGDSEPLRCQTSSLTLEGQARNWAFLLGRKHRLECLKEGRDSHDPNYFISATPTLYVTVPGPGELSCWYTSFYECLLPRPIFPSMPSLWAPKQAVFPLPAQLRL